MRRTTIRLDIGLLEDAKAEARRRGETLTSLIEKGLRRELGGDKPARKKPTTLPAARLGSCAPGLDLNSNTSIQAFLEEGLPPDKLR